MQAFKLIFFKFILLLSSFKNKKRTQKAIYSTAVYIEIFFRNKCKKIIFVYRMVCYFKLIHGALQSRSQRYDPDDHGLPVQHCSLLAFVGVKLLYWGTSIIMKYNYIFILNIIGRIFAYTILSEWHQNG
jgi:hypothetical protein